MLLLLCIVGQNITNDKPSTKGKSKFLSDSSRLPSFISFIFPFSFYLLYIFRVFDIFLNLFWVGWRVGGGVGGCFHKVFPFHRLHLLLFRRYLSIE